MRNFTKALILAAVSLVSVAASAQERETTDIDAIQIRQRGQDVVAQRFERRNQRSQAQPQQQQPQQQQQQRPVFQPRAPRDFSNAQPQAGVEVRRDRGGFERRFERPPQTDVEVRRDDRRFGNRSGVAVTGNGQPTQAVPQADGSRFGDRRFGGRRIEQSDGQRFGRNEEYRWDRDESRRLNRDDLRRRGEIAQGNNWQRGNDGRWQRRDGRNYGNRDNRDYGQYGGGKDFRWNNDWRRDSRYDWKSYRSSNRNFYRQPRYYDPFGSRYGYKRFGIGIVIGSGYYSDRYWISDPYAYRLPYADGPYRWIRYYDDVLLIDIRNGYVIDVIYDFFW